MEIQMEVGLWFSLEQDKDDDIILEMPYDNNGNGVELVIKKKNRRYFVNLIQEGFELLTQKEKEKVLKKSGIKSSPVEVQKR